MLFFTSVFFGINKVISLSISNLAESGCDGQLSTYILLIILQHKLYNHNKQIANGMSTEKCSQTAEKRFTLKHTHT